MPYSLAKRFIVFVTITLVAYSTWAGQKNLVTWFQGGESTVNTSSEARLATLPLPLAEFVFSKFGTGDPTFHLPREDLFKCYGELPPDQYWYSVELTNEGIRFVLPLTENNSCGEEIRATFEELAPFMNKQGLQHVVQLKKSRNAKRRHP